MRSNRAFALAIAGTVVIGQTALAAKPADALTPVSELRDVSPDHWAYNAIQTLIEKYQVMEGFPDKTFRGSKTLTRYEMAAALAKVMARVEERIAIATGQPINVDPGVNPEDLRTIARLQREFREELDQLKSRVDTIDSRVMALEKRVKISGYNRMDYRDWAADLPGHTMTNSPSADFRVRNSLDMDAQLTDELSFAGTLNADLYPPQSVANAFLRGTSGSPMMDVYLPRAEVNYNPGWISYGVGVGALRSHLPLGSTFADPFKTNAWTNGTGGYGFVGTPGVNIAGAATPTATQGPTGGFAGAPLWLPGTNVIVDMVDPNNSSLYAPHGDLLSAGHAGLGPLRVGLGFHRGALSGPNVFSGISANAASLPQATTWGLGSKVTATVGLDLGLLRINGVATGPTGTSTTTSVKDKWIGASVDLGSESLGLSAEVLGNSSLAFSDWTANRASARLGLMNILDTGFGLGFGYVAGNVATMAGVPGQASMIFAPPRNAAGLFSAPDFHSVGAMLKTPSLFIIPSFTLAAQQSGSTGGMFGALSTPASSGFTVQTEYQFFGLPALTIEYSRAKFGTSGNESLFGTTAFTHDQVGLATTVRF